MSHTPAGERRHLGLAREPLTETGAPATATIARHPIHPMLVPFPIALYVATLIADIVYWSNGNNFWALVAMWALGGAIVTSGLAALAGFTDFLGSPRIRAMSDAWQHMIANVINVVLAVVSFAIRMAQGAAEAVLPWGVLLSAIVVVLLLFSGWKGGHMVYVRRVAVQPAGPEPATTAAPHESHGSASGPMNTLRR